MMPKTFFQVTWLVHTHVHKNRLRGSDEVAFLNATSTSSKKDCDSTSGGQTRKAYKDRSCSLTVAFKDKPFLPLEINGTTSGVERIFKREGV